MLIGPRIRLLRKKKKISQEKLGIELSLSKTTISHYENESRIPSIETLIDIANYFEVDLNYILGLDNLIVSNKRTLQASDEEIEFLLEVRRLNVYNWVVSNPKKYAQFVESRLQ
ncbi:MAG: helix-turn-helix transcriptional regulator [Bacilli bacterium]|nr:helix-turn-helix transcriptional regulator [Bacilli bacterium]